MWLSFPLCAIALAGANADVGPANTPPMGFNTWNLYHCNINAQILTETATGVLVRGYKGVGGHNGACAGWVRGASTPLRYPPATTRTDSFQARFVLTDEIRAFSFFGMIVQQQ
jgi:hypothetical protein